MWLAESKMPTAVSSVGTDSREKRRMCFAWRMDVMVLTVGLLSAAHASLGSGTWRLASAMNFVESHDPVVTFGSIGYQYQFADDAGPARLERGGALTYSLGLGIAVSDDFSVSSQVSGYFQDETRVNGVPIPNSDIEPVSLRFSVVRRTSLQSRIQPYVDFGLNRDAADFVTGVRFIHDE
jgi:hypothetical protein